MSVFWTTGAWWSTKWVKLQWHSLYRWGSGSNCPSYQGVLLYMEKESGTARSFDPPFPVPMSQHFGIPKFCHLDPEYHFLFKYHIPCKFGECWPNNGQIPYLIKRAEGWGNRRNFGIDKTGLDLTGHFKKKKSMNTTYLPGIPFHDHHRPLKQSLGGLWAISELEL